MTSTQQAPVRQPTSVTVARWVSAVQAVTLLGFAAVAVAYVVRAQSAPEVTTGFGDFRGVVAYIGVLIAIASCVAAAAVGVPALQLGRYCAGTRVVAIVGQYVAASPVVLALLTNLHARHQLPLQLLGLLYVGLAVTALIALHHTSSVVWTANR